MTLMSFGNAMPIHMDMLQLVGYEPEARDLHPATTLNARKRTMREGRHSLVRATGADFEYDVAAWRRFLLDHGDDFGYTHPYAFQSVDSAVRIAMENPEVTAALAELEKDG